MAVYVGPMTPRDMLRMAGRIVSALVDLEPEQQRGVVGIAGITGPDHAYAALCRPCVMSFVGTAMGVNTQVATLSVPAT